MDVGFDICERTDRHTDVKTLIAILRTPAGGGGEVMTYKKSSPDSYTMSPPKRGGDMTIPRHAPFT